MERTREWNAALLFSSLVIPVRVRSRLTANSFLSSSSLPSPPRLLSTPSSFLYRSPCCVGLPLASWLWPQACGVRPSSIPHPGQSSARVHPSILTSSFHTSVVQCEPTRFSWSGGTPPYYLSVRPLSLHRLVRHDVQLISNSVPLPFSASLLHYPLLDRPIR